MFCFQSPFSRTSRDAVEASFDRGKGQRSQALCGGPEATSDDSGSSSIKYIDQLSLSDGSSTDTLPGIRTDYLEVEPISPGPEILLPPKLDLVFKAKTLAGSSRWRRKSHLGYGSTESLISTRKTSSSSVSDLICFSDNDNAPNKELPAIFATVNGIPTDIKNEFVDDDEDDDEDTCILDTMNTSSSPSSPGVTSAVTAKKAAVPRYGFLSVNGCAMRQESTSTSSPQLSTSSRINAEFAVGARSATDERNFSRKVFLKPVNLETTSCLPVARSCPNLERQSAGLAGDFSNYSPNRGLAGPRFKPLEEGVIQICCLNHTRTLVSKILSSKFLRRWETHHLYLNDACLTSKTLNGFMQQPVPYSRMSDVYTVARWDPTNKYCLRIVLPDGSLLLQASNVYTRDQWYHSILWKRSIFKYQHSLTTSTKQETMLRDLKSWVDFALLTPLQDKRVATAPLEAVAKLLDDSEIEKGERTEAEDCDRRNWAESVLTVAAPLLEKAATPPHLARVLSKLAQRHPRSPLVFAICPAITRCLKHTADFTKYLDMRELLTVFIAALFENEGGENAIRDYIASVHGSGRRCPHPRVLPNLVSICVTAVFHRFEVVDSIQPAINGSETLPPLQCYLLVLNVASEYADWRSGLAAILQPVPFPEKALVDKEVQSFILLRVMRYLANDSDCSVHKALLPIREPRLGWLHIAAPSASTCPDDGELFGEMLATLVGCCCRRKRFLATLMNQAGGDCILLAVRGCESAQEVLSLVLEWRLLIHEESKLQIVSALQSTSSGRDRYVALCQRQENLQELQQKGGPKKLTLPVRATDMDVALLLGGGALGNLESLSLAFTSVTSACAEQLIKLPALRNLDLWATQFGDAGLLIISEHLQKLQVLNLCETPVSDEGISTLASMTNLRKLNLNSTKLSAQTFESLKRRLPALQEFDVRYTEAW